MQININDLTPEVFKYIKALETQNNELKQENELLKKNNNNEDFTNFSEDKEEVNPSTEKTDEWFSLGDIAYKLFCNENKNLEYKKSDIVKKRKAKKSTILRSYQDSYTNKYENLRSRIDDIFQIVFLGEYKAVFKPDGDYIFNKKARDFIFDLYYDYPESTFWQYFDYLINKNKKNENKKKNKFIEIDFDLTPDYVYYYNNAIDVCNFKQTVKSNDGVFLWVYTQGVISDELFINTLYLIIDGFTNWYSSLNPNEILINEFNLYLCNVLNYYTILWLFNTKQVLYNYLPKLKRPIPKKIKEDKFFGFEYSPFYMEEYISFIDEKSKEFETYVKGIYDEWNIKKIELDSKQTRIIEEAPQKQDLQYFIDTIIDVAFHYYKMIKSEHKHAKVSVIPKSERKEDAILKKVKSETITSLIFNEITENYPQYREDIYEAFIEAMLAGEKKHYGKFRNLKKCNQKQRRKRKFHIRHND